MTLDEAKMPGLHTLEGRSTNRSECNFSWLSQLASAPKTRTMYLLRTIDGHGLKHAVCLDACEQATLLYDCGEPYPFDLSLNSLCRCCVEGRPGYLNYFDVLRVARKTCFFIDLTRKRSRCRSGRQGGNNIAKRTSKNVVEQA